MTIFFIYLVQIIEAVWSWAYKFIFDKTIGTVVFGMFIITMVYRFLLKPLVGGGVGSDTAKKKNDDD